MKLSKKNAIAGNYLIIVLVAVALVFIGFLTHESNKCSQEIIELFANRSNTEYKSLMDLSDRNVHFLDRNYWTIKGDEDYAEQEEAEGMNELRNVYNFEDEIFSINQQIGEKRLRCSKQTKWVIYLTAVAFLLLVIQLFISCIIVFKTKWK